MTREALAQMPSRVGRTPPHALIPPHDALNGSNRA